MATDTVPAQRTTSPTPTTRPAGRTPRENLAPAILALLVYLLAFAFVLAWPLLPAGLTRALFGATATAAVVVGTYVAATVGTRR